MRRESRSEPSVKLMAAGWQNFMKQLPDGVRTTEQLAQLAYYAGAATMFSGLTTLTDEERFGTEGRRHADAMVEEVCRFMREHEMPTSFELP